MKNLDIGFMKEWAERTLRLKTGVKAGGPSPTDPPIRMRYGIIPTPPIEPIELPKTE